MAEASVAVDVNEFSCVICLDLLKDPVTINCGHSYCMSCIKSCWDQEYYAGVYSCPQCRQTFTPKPVLGRNTILADIVKKLKKTGLLATADAGSGDVECDVCIVRKQKAVKSCLVCLASYCETHLQPHYEFPAFKKHKLTDATGRLQDKRKFQQRIQMKEKELQELREAVDSITSSAQSAVEDSDRIFGEMIRSIERRCSEVTQLIRDQEKAAVSKAEGDMERLKKEINELKRRHSEPELFSLTEYHLHFRQRRQTLPVNAEAGFGPRISVSPRSDFVNLRKVVSELKDQLENVCRMKMAEIHHPGTKDTVRPVLVPRTRAEFLQYSCQLTLDPNTASRYLSLSGGNVKWGWELQPYPDHPERFDSRTQVLCRESLTGRCYWEAEWDGRVTWIGVTYKGIWRKGESVECQLGNNDMSWSLFCDPESYSVRQNNKHTDISIKPSGSRRVGVYLDWGAGTLSFYRVSSVGLTPLYRFTASFTEPLYPGFGVFPDSSVSLCMLG